MLKEPKHVTVEEIARDVAGFLERVAREEQIVIVEKDGTALALVQPMPGSALEAAARAKMAANYDKFLSSLGSWKDVDTDKLIEDIYASRQIPGRKLEDL